MVTVLSRTRMCPERAAPVLGATVNGTGRSPDCGMAMPIVIHGTSAAAVQMHASCFGPPQAVGSLCCRTSNEPAPPEAAKLIAVFVTVYRQPVCETCRFWPAVGVGQRTFTVPSRGAS